MEPKKIVMLGATGAIGAPVLKQLLEAGCKIASIVRPRGNLSAEARTEASLKAKGTPEALIERLRVVEGDLLQKQCAADLKALSDFRGATVVDFAGELDFGPQIGQSGKKFDKKGEMHRPGSTYDTNVNGTIHALQLAEAIDAERFVYMSTAYVLGDGVFLPEGQFGDPGIFGEPQNAYEWSKQLAEIAVSKFRRHSVSCRSSIVGTNQVVGYLGFLRRPYEFAEDFRLGRMGRLGAVIKVDPDGTVHLPIAIKGNPDARLDIVGLDWVTAVTSELIMSSVKGKRAFNLVSENPATFKEHWDASAKVLGIADVSIVKDPPPLANPELGLVQKLYNRGTSSYVHYVKATRCFEYGDVKELLGRGMPKQSGTPVEDTIRLLREAKVRWDAERRAAGKDGMVVPFRPKVA